MISLKLENTLWPPINVDPQRKRSSNKFEASGDLIRPTWIFIIAYRWTWYPINNIDVACVWISSTVWRHPSPCAEEDISKQTAAAEASLVNTWYLPISSRRRLPISNISQFCTHVSMHNKLPGPYRATMEQDTQGGTMEIDLHFYTTNIFLRRRPIQ